MQVVRHFLLVFIFWDVGQVTNHSAPGAVRVRIALTGKAGQRDRREFHPVPIMDMQEAKELFFQYDGSRCYMSRDGRETDYLEAGVPREVEVTWLEELKRDKLRLLSEKGNWRVVYFFLDHGDLGHLAEFVQAEPRGVLWERCSYLEKLLTYADEVRKAEREPDLVAQAVCRVILGAERLLKRTRAAKSIERVRNVLLQAQQLLRDGVR